MTKAALEYSMYFKEGNQAKIGIRLDDKRILDVSGLIRFVEGDQLTLELAGSEAVEVMTAKPGSDALITFWTGWSLCRCKAVLISKIYGRRVFVRLIGQVNEKQTREYFRLDVTIPLYYRIPEKQQLPAVQEEWAAARQLMNECEAPVLMPCAGGFKVVRWNGTGEIAPRPVNLSGGGLRFKTQEYVQPGTLKTIDLFLPLAPPRVIHVVGETLRCNEILLGWEKGHNYINAARFQFINSKDREAIIAFIFAEQRRILSSNAGIRP